MNLKVLLVCGALGLAGATAHCVGDDSNATADGGTDATTDQFVGGDGGMDAPADTAVEAGPCDLAKPFGNGTLLSNVNGGQPIFGASLSPDELTLYLGTRTAADSGTGYDIFVATRSTVSAAFSTPQPLAGGVNTTNVDWNPWIAADGLSLFYATNYHLQVSVRASTQAVFPAGQAPVNVNETSGTFTEGPSLTADGTRMFMVSDRDGTSWLYETALGGGGSWSTPTKVAETASPQGESDPAISADGLTLYFRSDRAGSPDIYVTTRPSLSSPFAAPKPVAELNTSGKEWPVWLSVDECRLYYESDTQGTTPFELYVATR